jgi:4-aminobutyrate aminotransferase
LSAVIGRADVMDLHPAGSMTSTHTGNPVCCAAALATLDLVSSEYCANAARVGEYFIGKLRELQKKYACIGDVRGKGLMLGMELVEDRTTKAPATKLTEKLITQCYHNGMLLLSCGVSTIRFMPPLLVTKENVDEAIAILDASLGETQNA